MKSRCLAGILAVLPLLAGCGAASHGAVASASPQAWPGPSQGAPATATAAPTAEPTATATALPPTPAPTPTRTAPPVTFAPTPSAPGLPASLAGAEWTRLPTADRVIALTFDCGSNDAGAASILQTLSAQGVDATFFLTGQFAASFPADAQRMALGYAIGNHTSSHPHLPQLGDDAVVAQVRDAEAAIADATGRDPHPLFRFPYGDSDSRTLSLVHELGYGGIRWTVDTLGWKGISGGQSVDSVVQRVLAAAAPGAIVLMHVGAADDHTTLDADALPRVISELRARGYAFATVAQYVR